MGQGQGARARWPGLGGQGLGARARGPGLGRTSDDGYCCAGRAACPDELWSAVWKKQPLVVPAAVVDVADETVMRVRVLEPPPLTRVCWFVRPPLGALIAKAGRSTAAATMSCGQMVVAVAVVLLPFFELWFDYVFELET